MQVIFDPPMLTDGVVERVDFGRQATEIVVPLTLRTGGRLPDPLDHDYGSHTGPALDERRQGRGGDRKATPLLAPTMPCTETAHTAYRHPRKVLRRRRLPE